MTKFERDFRYLEGAICSFSTHARMREAWSHIRARYKDANRFERWRSKLEDELIRRMFSSPSEIAGINRHKRVYRWHPVEAVILIRESPLFAHLSIEEIAAECRVRGEPINDNHLLSWEPPKTDAYADMSRLAWDHGLFCRGCKAPREKSKFNFMRCGEESEYKFGCEQALAALCDDCVLAASKGHVLKLERQAIKQRRFEEARAERSRVLAERRAAQDEEFRKKRDAAKAARERAKVERAAAYRLVKDLGLLDLVRETTRDNGHEAETTH